MTETIVPAGNRAGHLRTLAVRTLLLASIASLAAGLALAPGRVMAAGGGAAPKVDEEALIERPTKVRIIGPDGKPAAEDAAPLSDVERYCTNIADPAKEARAAIQAKRLQELETQVSAKIDALEAKRVEYQDWLAQREAFIQSTSEIVIDIYAGMKPDAAAAQLVGLDRMTAASIVTRLKPRTASSILSEMPPEVAAELATLIVQKTNKDMDVATATPVEG